MSLFNVNFKFVTNSFYLKLILELTVPLFSSFNIDSYYDKFFKRENLIINIEIKYFI